MALIKCKECGKDVSTQASACPNCGAKVVPPTAPFPTKVVALLAGILVLGAIASHFSDEADKSAAAEFRAKRAAAERARLASLSPEQRAAEQKAKAERDEANRKTAALVAAEKSRRDAAVQRASIGAAALKKAMRNPDSFKLESALVIDRTGAVCYDYRAQNGFGGMNVGHAVYSHDGKRFLTSEMNGFAPVWNRECANKSGQDAAAAINAYVLR